MMMMMKAAALRMKATALGMMTVKAAALPWG